MRNFTPVILQAELKEALAEGGIVEAHCTDDAKKIGSAWTGNWTIALVVGDQKALLVNQRALEPREFKTIAGLISFAVELGLIAVTVPLKQGTSVYWTNGTEGTSQNQPDPGGFGVKLGA